MSLAKHVIGELPSDNSSPKDLSARSDLDERVDADAYEIEQESAKLQAEVHKLSKELEDLMSSRRLSEAVLRKEEPAIEEGREDAGDDDSSEEREDRSQPSSLERDRKSDFLLLKPEVKERIPNRDTSSPSFPPMPARPRNQELSTSLKSDSFGLVAPRPPPPTTEKKRPSSETRGMQSGWRRVNELLQAQGFRAIPIRGDGDAVDLDAACETLRDVLTDFSHCVESLDKAEVIPIQKRIKSLQAESEPLQNEIARMKSKLDEERAQHQEDRFEADRQARDAERQVSILKGKLETSQMQCKQRDQLIEQLKEQPPADNIDLPEEAVGSDRDKAIFKRFFGKEAKRTDEKVLELISAYEERRKKHTPEPRQADVTKSLGMHETIKDLRSQLDLQSRDIESLEKQRFTLTEENSRLKSQTVKSAPESEKHNSSEVLAKALEMLQLKSEKQLPMALKKMQQVIRALPSLENFIRSISSEVLSSSTDSNSVENVLPTIRTWKQKAIQWETANGVRLQFCHLLGLDGGADFGEIVGDT